MNQLLEQFLSESREALQGIAEKLMQLEQEPGSSELVTELFRLVHTLKGNSGLFDYPELTRVLHAGEDLMDAVRNGTVAYSQSMADRLLDAMDFVGILCDEIEISEKIDNTHTDDSVRLAELLRQMIGVAAEKQVAPESTPESMPETDCESGSSAVVSAMLASVPESVRMDAYQNGINGTELYWISYSPLEECFFQGDDPFFQARQTPGIIWGGISARSDWPALDKLDAYCCMLDFHVLSNAPRKDLLDYYRYVAEQVQLIRLSPNRLILPQGDPNGGPVYDDFISDALELLHKNDNAGFIRAVRSMLELSNPDLWFSSALRWLQLLAATEPENSWKLETVINSLRTLEPPDWAQYETEPVKTYPSENIESSNILVDAEPEKIVTVSQTVLDAVTGIMEFQREVLSLSDGASWTAGRLKSVAATLQGCLLSIGASDLLPELVSAGESAVKQLSAAPLLDWLSRYTDRMQHAAVPEPAVTEQLTEPVEELPQPVQQAAPPIASSPEPPVTAAIQTPVQPDNEPKFGRRAEDAFAGQKSLRVDQAKIDRLMNLIGEMVVAKNALPYLAGRAESMYGVRELSREIKAQYAVINRIAEEMQDSIMQVRMMPVSFVFQRFPRLVRDTSNKLGKEVHLILEGEQTEADKNIIEALGDPLVHIVRNSLDHGIETPEQRLAAGKSATGTLVIRASQEADRVFIEIRDDGKGIDPEVIKKKAYQKGLLSEEQLERITDQEAVNLVFAAGFSTAEKISDLSGRGVGMDVVRTAVEKVNGTVNLESVAGKGTLIRISLPLSMAVSNVMIVESNRQMFGVPMEAVVETVRVPRASIRTIKKSMATVLRGRIVPLKALNPLLGIDEPQKTNHEDEFAVLVVNIGDEQVGILVDEFHETVDIILKPMAGVLSGLTVYAGSALLGDGSVLMVLNIKEVV